MGGSKNKTNLSADESLKIENLTLICSHHLLFLVIHQLTGFEGGSWHLDSHTLEHISAHYTFEVLAHNVQRLQITDLRPKTPHGA